MSGKSRDERTVWLAAKVVSVNALTLYAFFVVANIAIAVVNFRNELFIVNRDATSKAEIESCDNIGTNLLSYIDTRGKGLIMNKTNDFLYIPNTLSGTMVSNSQGFSESCISSSRQSKLDQRVVLLGDSFTASQQVGRDFRWSHLIKKNEPSKTVWNLGVGGNGPVQHMGLIRKMLKNDILRAGDTVIYSTYLGNDITDTNGYFNARLNYAHGGKQLLTSYIDGAAIPMDYTYWMSLNIADVLMRVKAVSTATATINVNVEWSHGRGFNDSSYIKIGEKRYDFKKIDVYPINLFDDNRDIAGIVTFGDVHSNVFVSFKRDRNFSISRSWQRVQLDASEIGYPDMILADIQLVQCPNDKLMDSINTAVIYRKSASYSTEGCSKSSLEQRLIEAASKALTLYWIRARLGLEVNVSPSKTDVAVVEDKELQRAEVTPGIPFVYSIYEKGNPIVNSSYDYFSREIDAIKTLSSAKGVKVCHLLIDDMVIYSPKVNKELLNRYPIMNRSNQFAFDQPVDFIQTRHRDAKSFTAWSKKRGLDLNSVYSTVHRHFTVYGHEQYSKFVNEECLSHLAASNLHSFG